MADFVWSSLSGLVANDNTKKLFELGTNKQLLSSSTKAAIGINEGGKLTWLMRLDAPHSGAQYPHINIRHKFTGIADPHLQISNTQLLVASTITKALQGFNDYVLYPAYFGMTLYKLYTALKEDLNGTEKKHTITGFSNTEEAALEVGGTYLGGKVGATAGAYFGGKVGAAIGFCTGGILLVPATAIGTIIGAGTGAIAGATATQSLVKDAYKTAVLSSKL